MLLALPLSDDETLVVVVSLVIWGLTWFLWYRDLVTGWKLTRRRSVSRALALVPPAAMLVLFFILKRWSSFDVRESGEYLFQYLALGAAWLGLAARVFPWLGLSARDDVAERQNPAAAVALAGALLGLTFCYSGGNVGDGPGWWVVVFASGLASAGFFVHWLVLESATHASDAITIDRDLAAGLRHGAASVAQGLVLGRAAAGDWKSAAGTLADFARNGWPALVVLGVALLFERAMRPTGAAPRRSPIACGLVPGALLVVGALAWLGHLGEAA